MVKWINALYFSCGRMDISSSYPGLCARPMNTKSCSQSHAGVLKELHFEVSCTPFLPNDTLYISPLYGGVRYIPSPCQPSSAPQGKPDILLYVFFSFFSHFSCPFSWEEVKIAKLFALVCLSSIHFIFVLLSVTCAIFFLPGFSLRLKLSFITVARKSEIRTNWLLIFFI